MADPIDSIRNGYNFVSDVLDARDKRARDQIEQERGDRAYNALQAQYGAVAGDPERAAALQSLQQNSQKFTAAQRDDATQRQTLAATRSLRLFKDLTAAGTSPAQAWAQTRQFAMGQGFTEEELQPYGDVLVNDPSHADALLSSLEPGSELDQQTYVDASGGVVRLTRTGERRSYSDLRSPTYELGQDRNALAGRRADQADVRLGISQTQAGIARDRLEHQIAQDNPDVVREQSVARAGGQAQGTLEVNMPKLRSATKFLDDQVNLVLNSRDLGSALGLPTLRGISAGGIGSLGPPLPGTPAADALARLQGLASKLRLQAYESLRGAGQITEAESQFGQQAQANLDRAQSPAALIQEIRSIQSRLRQNLAASEEAIRVGRRGPSRTPGAAPAAPSRRDALADKYGLR